jgi:hypothetical protein
MKDLVSDPQTSEIPLPVYKTPIPSKAENYYSLGQIKKYFPLLLLANKVLAKDKSLEGFRLAPSEKSFSYDTPRRLRVLSLR